LAQVDFCWTGTAAGADGVAGVPEDSEPVMSRSFFVRPVPSPEASLGEESEGCGLEGFTAIVAIAGWSARSEVASNQPDAIMTAATTHPKIRPNG